jgi:C-terminal processing protease CtpA/Prc
VNRCTSAISTGEPDHTTQQYRAPPYVPRKRYVGKHVYVLTSGETASAAEALAYHLESRGRATIVGEATGGCAHPGRNVRIDAQFSVAVSQSRTINAVTKTGWEGTGVKPDIDPAAQALGMAHLRAREQALEREEDEGRKGPLKDAVEAARKERAERKD